MKAEMELLLSRQNAHDIASKYAVDANYLRDGYGIAIGRDGKCRLTLIYCLYRPCQ